MSVLEHDFGGAFAGLLLLFLALIAVLRFFGISIPYNLHTPTTASDSEEEWPEEFPLDDLEDEEDDFDFGLRDRFGRRDKAKNEGRRRGTGDGVEKRGEEAKSTGLKQGSTEGKAGVGEENREWDGARGPQREEERQPRHRRSRPDQDKTVVTYLPHATGSVPVIGTLFDYVKSPLHFIKEQRAQLGDVFTMDMLFVRFTFLLGEKNREIFFGQKEEDLAVWRDKKSLLGPLRDDILYQDTEWVKASSETLAKAFKTTGTSNRLHDEEMIRTECSNALGSWRAMEQFDLSAASSELVFRILLRRFLGDEFFHENSKEVIPLLIQLDTDLKNSLLRVLPSWLAPPHLRISRAKNRFNTLVRNLISSRLTSRLNRSSEKFKNDNLDPATVSHSSDSTTTPTAETSLYSTTILNRVTSLTQRTRAGGRLGGVDDDGAGSNHEFEEAEDVMGSGEEGRRDYSSVLIEELGERWIDYYPAHMLYLIMHAHANIAPVISWTLANVASDPNTVFSRVFATGEGLRAGDIDEATLKILAQSCCYETLRLYAPVALFRECRKEMVLDTDGKRVVPRGHLVAVSPAVVHRDADMRGCIREKRGTSGDEGGCGVSDVVEFEPLLRLVGVGDGTMEDGAARVGGDGGEEAKRGDGEDTGEGVEEGTNLPPVSYGVMEMPWMGRAMWVKMERR
ncbi:hypothetical protein HK102_000220 [Quaeritorhiza haematococci]|nr:hypothetical protein HK102_000220 [Quaeritorhiza haematococci]